MCYTAVCMFFVAHLRSPLSKLGMRCTGLFSMRSIEVYANNAGYEKSHSPPFCPRLLIDAVPTAHALCDKSNLTGWNRRQSRHPPLHFSIQSPTTTKNRSPKPHLSHQPYIPVQSSSSIQIHMPQRLRAPILALHTSPIRDSQAAAAVKSLRHLDGRIVIIVIVSPLMNSLAVMGLLL